MKKTTYIKLIVYSIFITVFLFACGEKSDQSTQAPPLSNEQSNEQPNDQANESEVTQPDTPVLDSPIQGKNIIFLIGDGMGAGQRKAAQWYSLGMPQKLVMDTLPINGWAQTAALDDPVTDSAAAGTALATGSKTYKGRISVYPDDNSLKTILEYAQEQGMSVGLVTTVYITDATPAAFAAHVPDRMSMRNEIAVMILDHQVDVLLGGGEDDFLPTSVTGCYPEAGHREDGRNLIDEAVAGGYTYVCDASALAEIDIETTEKLLGLFGDDQMIRPYSPSLVDMTQAAIDILSRNPNGFFLMVEGGLIDWACHGNNAENAINDTLGFDKAVSFAVSYAESNEDTLVIVTADHETGGMSVDMNSSGLPSEDGPFTMPDGKPFYVNWTTDYHTGADVPVSALGPGSEMLSGTYENTHIFDVMFSFLQNEVSVAATTATEEPTDDKADQSPSEFPETVTELVNGATLEFHDSFDALSDDWYLYENAVSFDGMVTITAQGNWESYWNYNYELSEGMASLLLFKFSSDVDLTLGHMIDVFGAPGFFFRGINEDTDRFDMKGEVSGKTPLTGNLTMAPDTWYYGLFAIGEDGEFLIRVWERDDPTNWAQNKNFFGDDWADKGWWFTLSLGSGDFSIDDFYSFSFSEIK